MNVKVNKGKTESISMTVSGDIFSKYTRTKVRREGERGREGGERGRKREGERKGEGERGREGIQERGS